MTSTTTFAGASAGAPSRFPAHARSVVSLVGKAASVSALVVVITFALGRVALSNPGRSILGSTATEEAVGAFNASLGLDDPLLTQFRRYLGRLATGDFGDSYAYQGRSVWSIVGPGLGVSAVLGGLTILVSVVAAVVLGMAAADGRLRFLDRVIRAASTIALSVPSALLSLVLILLVGVRAGVLPAGGWGRGYPDNFRYLVLPVVALSAYLVPILLRVVRERALVVLTEPHVEAALARGLPRRQVLVRHVLPNCAGPLLSVLGLNAGGLLSGAVVVEVVFGLPGLGRVAGDAVRVSDFAVLQGVALVAAVVVTMANLASEIAQRIIDPRLQ